MKNWWEVILKKITSSYSKSLGTLLKGIDCRIVARRTEANIKDVIIQSVNSDSREVMNGALFAAIKGTEYDGHDYIFGASAQGCVAVICEAGRVDPERLGDWSGFLVEVEDSAKTYGLVAAKFFDNPGEQLSFIGVTGTNGKTTVTYLLEQVLLQAGKSVGVIGTVNNRYVGSNGEQVILETRLTTPEPLVLQQLLREMLDAGVQVVIMEVSSHALTQNRIGGICFDFAAFTNLSRDHLDYHYSMENYFSAKSKLFSEHMTSDGIAVLPTGSTDKKESAWYSDLVRICDIHCARIILWGEEDNADIRLLSYNSELNETVMKLQSGDTLVELSSPLVGRFNIDNILTVFGLCSAMKIDVNKVADGLKNGIGAPGRLERVEDFSGESLAGPVVLVDYAHTPDALEQVLSAVAALPHRDLYCVFGCGGDRDAGKRPVMGKIGCRFSDVVIITDDNPRTEDPDQIIAQIVDGINESGLDKKSQSWLRERSRGERGIVIERERKKAIRLAVTAAGPEDVVLIAGKGHETYQLSIRGKQFFDDRLEARKVLCSWTNNRITRSVGGTIFAVEGKPRLLGAVTTDSRMIGNDTVFVALKGEKYDGHEFCAQAVENGAVCLVVEKEIVLPSEKNVSQIIVADTLKALGDMAAWRRDQIKKTNDPIIIGITGSCGKTTVKEMVTAILQRKWPEGASYPEDCVLKTPGNFNNLIGLPLSLLPLDLTNRAAVLEMGMNQPGELRRLAEIADPDISCIVNIHGAHLEGLHSIEGVARAKEELFAGTKTSGTLIINLDDPRVSSLAEKYKQKTVTFTVLEENMGRNPDMWVTDVGLMETEVITFTLHTRDEKEDVHLFAAGEHNVSNALTAAAIAHGAGASMQEIAAGLADFRPADKRMEILQSENGYRLLNDTYNANPASMEAGLKTLKQMAVKGSTAILGDMLELGETAGKAHFELGRLVAELAIDNVGLVGQFKDQIRDGALAGGFDNEHIKLFDDKERAVEWVNELISREKLGQGDLLLIKASRGLRFETIVAELIV